MVKAAAQPNQSLIDGIAVLQALAISPNPIGGRELARRLQFEPTRVNRILKTLAYLGIARQTANRKYISGPGMTVLAAQSLFASGIIRQALPALVDLREFGHTVAMGVLWRDNVSYLYHGPPGLSNSDAIGRIGLYPATKGGIGMVLLSSMEPSHVAEQYAGVDIPNYPDGVDSLLSDLQTIRKDGYVRLRVKTSREQHTVAVNVGTPVHSAIGVSGWIPENATSTIIDALRSAAEKIELAIQSRDLAEADANTELLERQVI